MIVVDSVDDIRHIAQSVPVMVAQIAYVVFVGEDPSDDRPVMEFSPNRFCIAKMSKMMISFDLLS